MDIATPKIVIATHYLVYGAPQALREYLINNKIKKMLFIAHPLGIDETKSYVEVIRDAHVQQKLVSRLRSRLFILNCFFEIFLGLKWFFSQKEQFDLWVGVDSLNAFLGVLLHNLGKVKKVVFYTIDYVPRRFKSDALNFIYHKLDKFCLRNADETWNVSARIAEGREKHHGLSRNVYNKQKVVPIGVWYDKVKRVPFNEVKKHQLIFVGNLLEKQGVQLVLEAMPEILKQISDFHFLIIGGGEYEERLHSIVRQMHLENYVTFTGWVKDRTKLDGLMADSAVAVALYDNAQEHFTYYADPTKIKDYLSVGLPIVLTDVSHNAQDIHRRQCGILVDYDKVSVAKAVISLMQDEGRLERYRSNALTYIKEFDWSYIFRTAIC